MVAPRCNTVTLLLRVQLAENLYNLLYVHMPLTLMCATLWLLLSTTGKCSKLHCRSAALRGLTRGHVQPISQVSHAALVCFTALLMHSPRCDLLGKALSAVTGMAAAIVMELTVLQCLSLSAQAAQKFAKWNAPLFMWLCQQFSFAQLSRGCLRHRFHLLCLSVMLLLVGLHVCLGLVCATAFLALHMILAGAGSHVADKGSFLGCEKRVHTGKENGPAQGFALGTVSAHNGADLPTVRSRHAASSCSGRPACHDPSDTGDGPQSMPSCPSHAKEGCECMLLYGHTALASMLLMTGLAVPSAIAAARSGTMRANAEDGVPAAVIATWAWMVACTCREHLHSFAEGMLRKPGTLADNNTLASKPRCGCSFSKIALIPVCPTSVNDTPSLHLLKYQQLLSSVLCRYRFALS
jgi:hypothetical protein